MTPRESFVPTRWSVIRTAGGEGAEARSALESLCEDYWFPVYGFLRQRGTRHEGALDWTQDFFATLIERHDIARADPERGRFRTYLLACLKHHVAGLLDRERAEKRGGGRIVSLDGEEARRRFEAEGREEAPERAFDRAWTRCLLQQVIEKLALEWQVDDKGELFVRLKSVVLLDREASLPYAELALELDTTEGALKSHAHRLRTRYRELLRLEVAQTVAGAAELEEELLALFRSVEG